MNTNAQALIQRIKERLPANVTGIRTDYSISQDGASRRGISIERFGKKNIFILVSPRDRIRSRAEQLLKDNAGVLEKDTTALLDAAHSLTEINDLGAWPLVADRREARHMSKHGIGNRSYKNLPGAEDLWLTVSANLPQIETIHIAEALDETPGRSNSRKSYASFRDRSGEEVAAIQLNQISRQVRDMSFPLSEEDYKNADRRTGRWAHQVGADQKGFIAAMICLLSIDNYFAPTEINLSN